MVFGDGSRSAILVLKDGRKITAQSNDFGISTGCPEWSDDTIFYFAYFDELQHKEARTKLFWNQISRIVIDEEVGRFRLCAHCKAIWPASFIFCPHDGSKTVWGELGSPIPTTSKLKNKHKTSSAKNYNLMEAILNASLSRSGIDPSSEEAEKAKAFSRLWLNPVADLHEIQKQLDELRQDFLEKSRGQ